MLAKHPLEVEIKLCNELEKELHEANDWVMQESKLSLLKHDMVRVDECQSNGLFQHASAAARDYIRKVERLEPLVESGFTKDDECCLVCGDTDYEEENMIGFCDLCGLSVHRECYGLLLLDATTDFVCFNCRAFGPELTMQSVCILCGHLGGA
mmetsp:Transcript_24453/g.32764  ORF Transcript_24453/g.32764 Transcript_24453/m.32764 type:complete len:153 (+) Transcript_24453:901-1359(+)|eukprot:CAMPEP_0185579924 /NCGR_PEP_ID=MMETSP0434-20130131/15491_1 /TAXON_ID=626734 ORGANISM="Favella taraikaensis, Strain Fe Narragansett Bay" /NCGR_SAMPLE_ID=MMETSP0434 /ASSEMBLY_ACC=CAM_ASM_000379 /LENGTH=152 /DNA_ID=CAMNT_0028198039 /DNA_START=900 /DNA_END=1358 /DNA_ORIENTATION=+